MLNIKLFHQNDLFLTSPILEATGGAKYVLMQPPVAR